MRPSMSKFDADDRNLEVAKSFNRPGPVKLNRPLIKCLEDLGIPDSVFLDLQADAKATIRAASQQTIAATNLLADYGLGQSFRLEPLLLNLSKHLRLSHAQMPLFLQQAITCAMNHALRELKYHTRIPVSNAYTLVGIADEFDWLEEGQIYAAVKGPPDFALKHLEGTVCISRSPVAHIGDVRLAHAVGKAPAHLEATLKPLNNVVIFSVKGQRPLPSMLGGGDLDGQARLHASPQLMMVQATNTCSFSTTG
jgi:RNA-dependent RNA polymerase